MPAAEVREPADAAATGGAPAALLLECEQLVRQAAALGPVVDLGCGRGRNVLACARWQLATVAIDRDRDALSQLQRSARASDANPLLLPVRGDLETDLGLPIKAESCGVILVFCFLFRPLAEWIVRALAPGGLLLYETFTREQLALGWGPRNPDFLLRTGELRGLFPGLEVLRYDEAIRSGNRRKATARLVARRPH